MKQQNRTNRNPFFMAPSPDKMSIHAHMTTDVLINNIYFPRFASEIFQIWKKNGEEYAGESIICSG
jgi:hypothetical protein